MDKNFFQGVFAFTLISFVILSIYGCEATDSSASSNTTTTTTSCDVTVGNGTYKYTIGNYTFCQDYPVYELNTAKTSLTGTTGVTISMTSPALYNGHYYVAVNVPTGNVSWIQAAYIANKLGGYLAVPNDAAENSYIFGLVSAGNSTHSVISYGAATTYTPTYTTQSTSDDTYFYHFDLSTESAHNGVAIGPFLGGFQPDSAVTSSTNATQAAYGWKWLDGTTMTTATGGTPSGGYVNWATDLYCNATMSQSCTSTYNNSPTGVDLDYRNNVQPNASGDGQPFMGFGELNDPVPTWGDYTGTVGEYGTAQNGGKSYGFVMEFTSSPW